MKKLLFFFFSGVSLVASVSFAIATAACSTNCSITSDSSSPPPYNQWAWNDVISWINLKASPSAKEVLVSDAAVTGIATSGVGDIYFDCASYPTPPSLPLGACSNYSKWKVSNDYAGQLGGYAWNDAIGWISFWGQNPDLNTCSPPPTPPATPSCYRVVIDNGNFSGYAWNDIVGWISFCGNSGGTGNCLASATAYQVNTSWTKSANFSASLESSIIDAANNVTLNGLFWHGKSNGGVVKFRIDASTIVTGPWSFAGPEYQAIEDVAYQIPANDRALYAGKRYFRYKIILEADSPNPAIAKSPNVEDVIINWSR